MTLFATANITVIRGYDGKTRGGGAFLSIIITFLLSLIILLILVARTGLPTFNQTAVAWFVLAGFLTIFIGRVFLYASIQHLGAIRASAIKRLNPFFSVLLGVVLLGESVSGLMMVGMALIVSSFVVLVRQSINTVGARVPPVEKLSTLDRIINLGYLYGPISAFAYACGYVARKQGLTILPDAAFGTMVGALTGIVFFVITARFIDSYREDIVKTFTVFNPWFLFAGIFASLGQICYFVALSYITISKIALITSMEVFITLFLTVVVLRSRESLTGEVLVAAGLGVLGTVFVILN